MINFYHNDVMLSNSFINYNLENLKPKVKPENWLNEKVENHWN